MNTVLTFSSERPPRTFSEARAAFISYHSIHTELVREFLSQAAELGLVDDYVARVRAAKHDAGKLKEPEIEGFVVREWRKTGGHGEYARLNSDWVISTIEAAKVHHVTKNTHHPQYHFIRSVSGRDIDPRLLVDPRGNLDLPAITMDCRTMPETDLVEMACDWCAVSEYRSEDPREWFRENLGLRWDFGRTKNAFLGQILDEIWESSR